MRDIFSTRDNFCLYAHIKSHFLYGDFEKCGMPAISILMPVYAHPYFFRFALESAINQDYGYEYEIIVVDNHGLTDGINDYQKVIIEYNAPNVFYYRNEKNIGVTANLNRCIELARAPFITFCHDDDMLLPDALSRLMKLQNKFKKAILSSFNTIDKDGNYISMYSKPKLGILTLKDAYRYKLCDQFVQSGSTGLGCLFARESMIEIGGYDEEFYPSGDYALCSCYIYRFGAVFSNNSTINYRIAENGSMSGYIYFADIDKHIRECIKKKLPYPGWILNIIIRANYNISKIVFAVDWGNKPKSLLASIRFSDRFIMKIVRCILNFKKYKMTLSLNPLFKK
jgi:glycosyltransferase involved in cell wall biosynthesis